VALQQQGNAAESRASVDRQQLEKLNLLLEKVLPTNVFYHRKLGGILGPALRGLEDLRDIPFTTKQQLIEDQANHPLFGTNLTFPLERYVRVHQTSGTSGRPLYWLDTEESWDWWAVCWRAVFEAAGVRNNDRIFFPFSFGP